MNLQLKLFINAIKSGTNTASSFRPFQMIWVLSTASSACVLGSSNASSACHLHPLSTKVLVFARYSPESQLDLPCSCSPYQISTAPTDSLFQTCSGLAQGNSPRLMIPTTFFPVTCHKKALFSKDPFGMSFARRNSFWLSCQVLRSCSFSLSMSNYPFNSTKMPHLVCYGSPAQGIIHGLLNVLMQGLTSLLPVQCSFAG